MAHQRILIVHYTHTRTHADTDANTPGESDEHAQCKLVVLFSWRVTNNILSSPQVMPSQQAPVPSCRVIRAPPPWPLTLHTDRPTPAVCRWRSFGLRMLMRVKHNLPEPTLSFLPLCLKSSTTQAALYFYLSQRAVQSPGGLFLSFSLLPPMASCSISVSLLLAVLLALSYMHLIFSVLHLSSPHACHTLP